jgi:ABC-2 type transport system permease protein
MNAVVDNDIPTIRSRGPVGGHATRSFKWLLKREFWEHKGGFFWAPLVAGAISLLLTLIGGGTGHVMFRRLGGKVVNFDGREMPLSDVDWNALLENSSPQDLEQLREAVNLTTLVSASWPLVVFSFVVFFYFLGSLYDERKDRSVLFWKSLPVSDRDTVLSKLATGLLVGPLVAVALGIATMIGFGLIASFFMLINGANPFTLYWSQLDPLLLFGGMVGWIPVYVLWALPTAGWLMLCSAWARSKPFLWATAIPIVAGLLVSWSGMFRSSNFDSGWFWEHVVLRLLTSAWPGSHILGYVGNGDIVRLGNSSDGLLGINGMLAGTHLLATPSLWIGVAAGVAMLLVAIRLRRWRDEG